MQKGSRGSQRRVFPKRRAGIANEQAPYWNGERAEDIVAARHAGYQSEAEAKKARRHRIDLPTAPEVGVWILRPHAARPVLVERIVRYKSGARFVALFDKETDGHDHINRARQRGDGVWIDDAKRPIVFAAPPTEARARRPRGQRAARAAAEDRTRERSPNQQLRRLERALKRRKTLAARQRVQAQIAALRQQLGLD